MPHTQICRISHAISTHCIHTHTLTRYTPWIRILHIHTTHIPTHYTPQYTLQTHSHTCTHAKHAVSQRPARVVPLFRASARALPMFKLQVSFHKRATDYRAILQKLLIKISSRRPSVPCPPFLCSVRTAATHYTRHADACMCVCSVECICGCACVVCRRCSHSTMSHNTRHSTHTHTHMLLPFEIWL